MNHGRWLDADRAEWDKPLLLTILTSAGGDVVRPACRAEDGVSLDVRSSRDGDDVRTSITSVERRGPAGCASDGTLALAGTDCEGTEPFGSRTRSASACGLCR